MIFNCNYKIRDSFPSFSLLPSWFIHSTHLRTRSFLIKASKPATWDHPQAKDSSSVLAFCRTHKNFSHYLHADRGFNTVLSHRTSHRVPHSNGQRREQGGRIRTNGGKAWSTPIPTQPAQKANIQAKGRTTGSSPRKATKFRWRTPQNQRWSN